MDIKSLKKGKKRNRRVGEPFKVRAKIALRRAAKVAAFVVPVPVLAYGAVWTYGELTTTTHLAITEIMVAGAERVEKEELLGLSGITVGQNILSFSGDEVSTRLRANPWIESVEVDRVLPGTVGITVKERRPAALVKLDTVYVMDAGGVIFKRYSADDALDLPMVTGLTQEALDGGEPGLERRLLELIAVLSGRKGFNIAQVSEIKVDPAFGLSIYTLDEGVRLDVGTEGFEEKLTSFERILATRGGVLKGIEAMDLNNHREVIVRFTTDVVQEGGEGNGQKG